WPIVLIAALGSPSLHLDDLTLRMVSVPVLTAIALIAKLVSVAMSCVLLLALARVVRRTFDRDAGRWAFSLAGLNGALAYYGRTSNLDGPYLMWAMLSLDRLLDAIERSEREDLQAAAIFGALALATKDQAYALYVFAVPFAYWIAPQLRSHWRRDVALPLFLTYGVASGALFNPLGFIHRLGMLQGENSQDWRHYQRSLAGVWANLRDVVDVPARYFWPWPFALIGVVGALFALQLANGAGALARRSVRSLLLLSALSSLICFTLVVGRSDPRFVLPIGVALSAYAGVLLACATNRLPRMAAVPFAIAVGLLAAPRSLALHLTQWGDARREVERALAALPASTTIETYGLGVYLPRFDRAQRVRRVAPLMAAKRPIIPGVVDIDDAYGHVTERAADVLVISDAFANRFVARADRPGEAPSRSIQRAQGDRDAQRFFSAAMTDRLAGYHVVRKAEPHLPRWAAALGLEPIALHGSTGAVVWMLARDR
ncbi:MAG TPA: glycosyltransferase family 39 protein, partial [Polyangiales bacterium]|nr:glycosyltransferase family 39 protein [Polyangiales bacterium]